MKNYNERIKSIQKKAKRMKAVQFTVNTAVTMLMIGALAVCMSVFGPHLLKQLHSMFIPTGDILGQPSTVPSTTVDPLPELKYDTFRVTEEERAFLGVSPSEQVIRLYTARIHVEMGRFDTIPDAETLFAQNVWSHRFYLVCHEKGFVSIKCLEYSPEGDARPIDYASYSFGFWEDFYIYGKHPEYIFPFPVTVKHIYFDYNYIGSPGYIYFETEQGDYVLYRKSSKSNLYLFPVEVFYEISKAYGAFLDANPSSPEEGGPREPIDYVWDIEPYKVGVKYPGQLMVYNEEQMQYAAMCSANWVCNGEESISASGNILDPSVDLENDIPRIRLLYNGVLPFKFTIPPNEITVRRWPIGDVGKPDAYENGELVAVNSFDYDDTAWVQAHRGIYIYEITAIWNDVSGSSGSATYAFIVEWDPVMDYLGFEQCTGD